MELNALFPLVKRKEPHHNTKKADHQVVRNTFIVHGYTLGLLELTSLGTSESEYANLGTGRIKYFDAAIAKIANCNFAPVSRYCHAGWFVEFSPLI